MHRRKSRPTDQPVDADEHGSFGQSRFAKPLNHQLGSFLYLAPSDPRRYCESGIDLEHTSRRLTGLGVASEMGESGREAAVWSWMSAVVTQRFLRCNDGLVKATKLNKGKSHPGKR